MVGAALATAALMTGACADRDGGSILPHPARCRIGARSADVAVAARGVCFGDVKYWRSADHSGTAAWHVAGR